MTGQRHLLLFVFLVGISVKVYAHAQPQVQAQPQPSPTPQKQSALASDFQREGEDFQACKQFDFGSIGDCLEHLFTDHPLHIAVGSIAPQNGFGAGLAFLTQWTWGPLDPESPGQRITRWELSLDADAVASNNESWRAGVYLTAVYVPKETIKQTSRPPKHNLIKTHPVFNLYAQGISLNQVGFFGIGQNTTEADRSFFGMREVIVGGNGTVPVSQRLHLAVYGEANGRFVDIRGTHGLSSPSIEQIFNQVTAPGLLNQPAFAQFGEGIRLEPTLFDDHLRLDYRMTYQQFVAPGEKEFGFQRFTVDLAHQIPLYRNMRTLRPREGNGPDDCSETQATSKHECPKITRNLEGSFGIRFLISESFVPSGHFVPFYFQPTLGGADINGSPSLGSYQDYRFRAPDILLLRGSFEHSIYGPLGLSLMVDEGRVATDTSDLHFTHLLHSYYAGLTLRAGGLPQVWILFGWGGHEGTHTIAQMNTSLLGGAGRPSLY